MPQPLSVRAAIGRHPLVAWALLLALSLSALYVLLNWQLNRGTGLMQTYFHGVGADRTPLVERVVRTVDLTTLEDQRMPRRHSSIRWHGVWFVPRKAFYDLSLKADAHVVWKIDDQVAHEVWAGDAGTNPRTVSIGVGFHAIDVEYEHDDGPAALDVSWAPTGDALQPLNPNQLLLSMPRHPGRRALGANARTILRALGAAIAVVAVCVGLAACVQWTTRLMSRAVKRSTARVIAVTLAALVIAYAASLRFDALTLKYGPVSSPAWLHALQERSQDTLRTIRPARLTWSAAPTYPHRDGPPTRYISDPYTYLVFAREMRSFYGAHYREPLFPFVTKISLRLLHDQDVAVSFASALFSVLAVFATYLLGSYAFSRGVGLGAALAMAIEHDVISWGVSGWRDDAFMCSVGMCAYAMVRHVRVPSRGSAILLGVCAGIACLIRVTALSFLLPGFVCLLVMTRHPWKERLMGIGLVILVMTIVAGPFLFNCWRAYGDPLYAINVHAQTYLLTEGHVVDSKPSAAAYVGAKALSRPFGTLDAVALGLTSYPFLNKWTGFEPWLPMLGNWLSWAALLGLVLFLGSDVGRLVLVVLVASLVPFAVTWKLLPDWRFTAHAYPFFLIAACFAIGQIIAWAAPSRLKGLLTDRGPTREQLVFWTVILGCIGAGGWTVVRALPVLTLRESLRAKEGVTITAGARDAAFFGEGWSEVLTAGNVTARVSEGPYSVVWLPLPSVDDHALTLRLDPFPRPPKTVRLPTVRVFVNGNLVSALPLGWNPGRVGSYDVPVSRAVLKQGSNRVALMVDVGSAASRIDGRSPVAGITDGAAFLLWYVQVRPRALSH